MGRLPPRRDRADQLDTYSLKLSPCERGGELQSEVTPAVEAGLKVACVKREKLVKPGKSLVSWE